MVIQIEVPVWDLFINSISTAGEAIASIGT